MPEPDAGRGPHASAVREGGFDPRTGEPLWEARVGPPTSTGSRRGTEVPVTLALGEVSAALVVSEAGETLPLRPKR